MTKITRFFLNNENNKFSLKCTPVWCLCLKNYSFQGKLWKSQILMKLVKNNKFSSRILSCSVIFIEKLKFLWKIVKNYSFSKKITKIVQNIKFSTEIAYRSVIFIENLHISGKITKIVQNIKFSTEIAYRSVIFIEKLHISGKITNFNENDQIWLVFSKLVYTLVKTSNFSMECIPFSDIHWKITLFMKNIEKL